MGACDPRSVDAPVAGRDYPRTLREFNAWFRDDEACLDYLIRLRWPAGFVCPFCRARGSWRMSKGRNLRCAGCRADISVTAGSVFADSRLPLTTWFAAAWHVCAQKPGVSALGLKRVLGLGSYETAWSLLHKLRRAMVRSGRDRLAGELEVDESYVGRRFAGGKRGRGTKGSRSTTRRRIWPGHGTTSAARRSSAGIRPSRQRRMRGCGRRRWGRMTDFGE